MPHDKNGNLLQNGDRVLVPCTVNQVHTGEEYCNVTLLTDEPMYPGDSKTTITLNAKQVISGETSVIDEKVAAVFEQPEPVE